MIKKALNRGSVFIFYIYPVTMRLFVGYLILLTLATSVASGVATVTNETDVMLRIETLSPKPNYRLTIDPDEINQLADGRTERYPIWTTKRTVGWHQRTPVTILMRLETEEPSLTGILRLHTARGSYAGVEVPVRIDIYMGSSKRLLRHVVVYAIRY